MKYLLTLACLALALAGCDKRQPAPVAAPSNANSPAPLPAPEKDPVAALNNLARYITQALDRAPDRQAVRARNTGRVTEAALRDLGLTYKQVNECAALVRDNEVRLDERALSLKIPPKDGRGGTAVSIPIE